MEPDENDCLENWEDLEDSKVLEKRLERIGVSEESNEAKITRTDLKPIVLITNSRMGHGHQPLVTILKRPEKDSNELANVILNGDSKPKLPTKSLQQREQEYAEARLRILGEAPSPSDFLENSIPQEQRSDEFVRRPLSRPEENSVPTNIIRQPLGPDGTAGFNRNR